MPYDPNDARAALASPPAPAAQATDFAGAEYVKFYEVAPAEKEDGGQTWYARGQNFVLAYTDVSGEITFRRSDQPDEYAVILTDPTLTAEFTVDGRTEQVGGETLTFVPPGDSTLHVSGKGRLIRLLSSHADDLAAKASNASSYQAPHPNVADLTPWPDPVGGFRLRTYSLDVPGLDNPPFRLFRCSTFMVNYIRPQEGPRDPAKMSPHVHDDFEQCSVILEGEYVHHIRWPWTTDLNVWRADEHEACGGPSVTVIPPPSVHTSQATGSGTNHLIDIFAPPRADFSKMPDWVLNADDYPMPD